MGAASSVNPASTPPQKGGGGGGNVVKSRLYGVGFENGNEEQSAMPANAKTKWGEGKQEEEAKIRNVLSSNLISNNISNKPVFAAFRPVSDVHSATAEDLAKATEKTFNIRDSPASQLTSLSLKGVDTIHNDATRGIYKSAGPAVNCSAPEVACAAPEVNSTVPSINAAMATEKLRLINAAAVNGDKSSLVKIVDGNASLLWLQDDFGRTPLMIAVLADRLEIAQLIFKKAQKSALPPPHPPAAAESEEESYLEVKDKGGRTALHCAAHKGNVRCVKFLLSKGADPLAKDENGSSALHLSTRHKSSKCLDLILNRLPPGGVDDQDRQNRTALHLSASFGNLKHVRHLLKNFSNICIPDCRGKTPLHWASTARAPDAQTARETTAIVRLFREESPSVVNWPDYEGRTGLHVAIAEGNTHIVAALISEEECNVNAMDNMFRTPLHWAAALGRTQVVNMLLTPRSGNGGGGGVGEIAPNTGCKSDHQLASTTPTKTGADWSTSDANGATPLHYAAQNNYDGTVRAFLYHADVTDIPDLEGRTALMWAACEGADDVVRTMISGGSDIGATDKTGGTTLHVAAYAGKSSTVHLLVSLGGCVDGTDLAGHTPLFRACQQGHLITVQTLLQVKARVDIADTAGRSPLHWAGLSGHGPIARLLIKHGLSPNHPDHSGRAPIHCAAFCGFVNCVSVLLENGADPNFQDNEGKTPLHWSCSQGHLDATKLLLDQGAFPNVLDFSEERFSPLDGALLGGHNDVAQLLIEHGGLSINRIQDVAASVIQAAFRGYRVRKSFQEKMNLMIQHDQLRKEFQHRKRAREAERIEAQTRNGGEGGAGRREANEQIENSFVTHDDLK